MSRNNYYAMRAESEKAEAKAEAERERRKWWWMRKSTWSRDSMLFYVLILLALLVILQIVLVGLQLLKTCHCEVSDSVQISSHNAFIDSHNVNLYKKGGVL